MIIPLSHVLARRYPSTAEDNTIYSELGIRHTDDSGEKKKFLRGYHRHCTAILYDVVCSVIAGIYIHAPRAIRTLKT